MELASTMLPGGDVLTLRRRGADFEIRLNLAELMSSRNPASEAALAELACARIDPRAARVLIGGLGMGYSLRAVLDRVGDEARVTVAELVPEVIAWNRGPLAELAGRPLDDPRTAVFQGDFADAVAAGPGAFDAVLMDVDNGPDAVLFGSNRRLYSAEGVALLMSALKPGGVLALWAAGASARFERAVEAAGAGFERVPVEVADGDGRVEHWIYLIAKA